MRVGNIFIVVAGTICCASLGMRGHSKTQPVAETEWTLPLGLAVKDAGPRSYRFTVEYTSANSTGEILQRQRFTADYTRGLPGGEVTWKDVTAETAKGATGSFGAPETRDFMEGFRYRNDLDSTLKPDFFRGFPPGAVMERNLVWDTGMIEKFGQNYFDRLKLNQPYQEASDDKTDMPGVGTFHNHNIVLEWVGRSRRNGVDCAVIEYQAFFNRIELAVGGMNMKGRSDYWGRIWVALATKQIEYGSLYESVVGEMKLPGRDTPQVVNVFRTGDLEPINAK